MEISERIRQGLALDDPEGIDTLLEIAELARTLLAYGQDQELAGLIRYTVARSYYDAFFWAIGILEESGAKGFACELGACIPDYDELISRLQVNLDAAGNDVLPVRDENGEIQAFFNIITYKTGFRRIELVTEENYDSRDNDYIRYKLVITGE